jgi:hypothetical protein
MRRPVMYSARFSACVPMSPMHPAAPERLGSVRQAACFWPDSSMRVAFYLSTFKMFAQGTTD